ncbi:response regulator transcription factor [Yoonia sp. GPGPB17]|uniref:response regulator transcription factor n=1 Tax=Yoonia sp. GPGPB17 TaxID=3026147 RepID=UPI0030BB697F
MILVADDDAQIRDVVRIALTQAGLGVAEAGDGHTALEKAESLRPDLIILDIGMPEMDGLEVCRALRKTSEVPILFLTARADEIDRVVGLELGADDYVSKPFSPRELVARVRAILKRSQGEVAARVVMRRGVISVDPARHLCHVHDAAVPLTSREMDLLERLIARPDHVMSRPQLVDAIYGTNVNVSDRTMDSHLRNLRSKLDKAGCADAIETVHGVGIRMGACRGA